MEVKFKSTVRSVYNNKISCIFSAQASFGFEVWKSAKKTKEKSLWKTVAHGIKKRKSLR
jgi:hypothetical protein